MLLLPGGMCSAGSYAELMAEPGLAGMRLVAATLPGHAGTPPPDDYSIECYARLAAELAKRSAPTSWSVSAWVPPSRSRWSSSGRFTGPAVLLGISLSAEDEPAFFRAIVRLGSVLGSLPASVLAKGAASMVKRVPVPAERQAELREDFRKNDSASTAHALREYVRWLQRHERPAERLCQAGVPTWIVHAEKGDGGLTDDERRTLQAAGTRSW